MTKAEIEARKAELEAQIDGADAEKLAELRSQIEAVKAEKPEEPTVVLNVTVDERSLLREPAATVEQRAAGEMKAIKKPEEEKKMEIKNIYATEEYRSAFFKKLQGVELNEEEQRAMTSATSSVGYAIPTTTLNKIDELLRQTSALYNEVDVLGIPGYLSIPKEKSTNDANWIAEDNAATDSADTLDVVNFAAYKLIRTISITAEVAAMAIDAFEAYIVKKLSDKMAIAIENAILNGDGNGEPTGILTETITTVTYTTSPTYANLCSLMKSLKAGYKPGAKLVMSSAMIWDHVAQMTVNDKLIFLPDPTGEFAGKLFGKPVIEDEYIADDKILFGNFKKYTLNFNKPIEITADNSIEFRKGNKVYRAMGLVDGKTVNTEGFALLEKAAASI